MDEPRARAEAGEASTGADLQPGPTGWGHAAPRTLHRRAQGLRKARCSFVSRRHGWDMPAWCCRLARISGLGTASIICKAAMPCKYDDCMTTPSTFWALLHPWLSRWGVALIPSQTTLRHVYQPIVSSSGVQHRRPPSTPAQCKQHMAAAPAQAGQDERPQGLKSRLDTTCQQCNLPISRGESIYPAPQVRCRVSVAAMADESLVEAH